MFIVARARVDVCAKCRLARKRPRKKIGADIEFGRRGEAEMAFLCMLHAGQLVEWIHWTTLLNPARRVMKLEPLSEEFSDVFDRYMASEWE